jgi:glycogen synthase
MRVLMFGWEFPPHISGGLGTACFGLTSSLRKLDVDILFVIPRADHEQASDRFRLINASRVYIDLSKEEWYSNFLVSANTEEKYVGSNILTLKVSSGLCAYSKIEKDELTYTDQLATQHTTIKKQKRSVKMERARFPFTGTYGPRLLEEVDHYALVASQIARRYTFDVIHAHDWLTYKAGMAAKKVSGKPLVVHVHATEFDRSGENVDNRVYSIEKEGMLQAEHVVAVSQWTKSILVDRYGIPDDKISVVHNGVMFKEPESPTALANRNHRVVTFLGRITYQKGPHYFVHAAQKVLQRFPDAHFVMAGSGDLLPEMMALAAKLKISSRIHFTGFLKGGLVDKMWAMSNVYVMPSVSEPFGIAPLEAAQANVPVIISKQSGVSEVIRHAIKVDFWDVEALANAICSVLSYSSLRKTLQKNVRHETKLLSWDRAAAKMKNIYIDINNAYHEK